MARVLIKTYGCQMNERDSEQVSRMLVERGHTMTTDENDADVILLNTCSVRDMAERKAVGKMINLGHLKRDKPELVLGFLGCMAQSRGDQLLKDVPKTDLVVGTQKFHLVADYVEQIIAKKASQQMDDLRFSIVDTEEEEGSQSTIRDHIVGNKQATAFVSIMQGCNMKCTFCIVPFTRGAERGRTIPSIVDEVKSLADKGVKEVTLLGQIVNLYGRHEQEKIDGKSPFVQLLTAVNAIDGIERIRFTSPHPMGFRDDLVEAYGTLDKLVEHIHLPVQSGSDRILKAMHRPYTAQRYLELVSKLRAVQPKIAICTDIIVGFPGETDEDYLATKRLAEEVEFDNAFIFRYSKRKDTPAVELEGQLPESVKEERNQDLLQSINAVAERKTAELIGQTVEILCEGVSRTNDARLMGRTRTNKIVVFEGDESHIGRIINLKIERATPFTLYGESLVLS